MKDLLSILSNGTCLRCRTGFEYWLPGVNMKIIQHEDKLYLSSKFSQSSSTFKHCRAYGVLHRVKVRYFVIDVAEHLRRNCINVSNRCVALYDVKMNMMSYVKITRTKFRAVFANGRHFLSALAKCAVITYR